MKKIYKLMAMLAMIIAMLMSAGACSTQTDDQSAGNTDTSNDQPVITVTEQPVDTTTEQPTDTTADRNTHVLSDYYGDITLASEATRIVTTAPAYTTAVIMAGAGDKIVALDNNTPANEWIMDKCPYLADLPIVAAGDDLNMEALVKTEPDLVVLAPRYKDAYFEQLKDVGIPCISKPVSQEGLSLLDTVRAQELYFCDAIGGDSAVIGQKYKTLFDSTRNTIMERTKDLTNAEKPKVIEVYNLDPLTVIGGGGMAQQWITLAGGINAAENATGKAGISGRIEVTMEQILVWDPDYIVCFSPDVRDGILNDSVWADITAVQTGHVINMPSGAMLWGYYGPEEALMMPFIAKVLHPDMFTDFDMIQRTKDFYQNYFGFTVSNADIQEMFRTDGPIADLFK